MANPGIPAPSIQQIAVLIRPQYVVETASFAKPPTLLQNLSEAVSVLLGESNTKPWSAFQTVLRNNNFLTRILNIDAVNISQARIRRAKEIMGDPNLASESMRKVSRLAELLSMWATEVINIWDANPVKLCTHCVL